MYSQSGNLESSANRAQMHILNRARFESNRARIVIVTDALDMWVFIHKFESTYIPRFHTDMTGFATSERTTNWVDEIWCWRLVEIPDHLYQLKSVESIHSAMSLHEGWKHVVSPEAQMCLQNDKSQIYVSLANRLGSTLNFVGLKL